jgi:hypothetical protein
LVPATTSRICLGRHAHRNYIRSVV